jgi:hypothetical protein
MTELVKYDAACRALAEARSVDEVEDSHHIEVPATLPNSPPTSPRYRSAQSRTTLPRTTPGQKEAAVESRQPPIAVHRVRRALH